MKANTIIKRRFTELEEMTSELESAIERRDSSFEKFHQWGTSVLSLLLSVFGASGPHYTNFSTSYSRGTPGFKSCKGIFQAAKEDYESGYLFSVRGLIKAEDSADILDQATELLGAGYKDPACVLAGVALEITLKELSFRNEIVLGNLNAMNEKLCKAEVYNMGMQKQITAWAHWRNKAAHGEWNEYNTSDVEDMIKGVTRFVADYL